MHEHRTDLGSVEVKTKKKTKKKKKKLRAFWGLNLLPMSMSLTQADLFYLHKDCRTTPLNAISPAQREGNPEEIGTADKDVLLKRKITIIKHCLNCLI